MITVDNRFDIGETVYLKTDRDQLPRIVFAFIVSQKEIIYRIASGRDISDHYNFELSLEKDVLITVE